jgi:acyl-CoA thioesterase I
MIAYENPWLVSGETLVCFGDSITASETGYVSMLSEKLAKSDIKVINAGRGGDKTTWGLTRFQQDIIDVKPDAVSIYLGANDAAVGRGRWADEPTVSVEAYRTNLVWMIFMCRQNGIEKISIITPALRFEGDTYAEHGNILEAYCLAARAAADEMQCPLVPLDTMFAEEWAKHPGHTGLLLTRDGTHMTEAGNQLITQTILKTWGLD